MVKKAKDFSRQESQLMKVTLTRCLPSAWGSSREFASQSAEQPCWPRAVTGSVEGKRLYEAFGGKRKLLQTVSAVGGKRGIPRLLLDRV